jgi:putative phosphoribosyl transferase
VGFKRFKNRVDAGEQLAARLQKRAWAAPVVVLALPRGGVPVAAEVASTLHTPLDILVVRKVGAPGHEELACGAVAPDGVLVWNEDVLRALDLSHKDLARTVEREQLEVARREAAIRTPLTPPMPLNGASVILVDDGLATGATMRAAIQAVQQHHPRELVVALPVGPGETCEEIQSEGQCSVECLHTIEADSFGSVGEWYDEFSQVETEECRELLHENRAHRVPEGHPEHYH